MRTLTQYRSARFSAILLALAFISLATPLPGQYREEIRSIRVHGEMELNGRTLNLSQSIKGQDRIRATIQAKSGQANVTVFLIGEKILLEEDLPDKKRVRQLSGSDAATHLLDLLALNPEYHFRRTEGFDLRHPALKGFSLKIRREEIPDPDSRSQANQQMQPIAQIQLFDDSRKKDTLIRSIRYLERFPEGPHGRSPRKIEFIDHTTGATGTITLNEYEYNAGLLDFLFVPPAVSDDKNAIEQTYLSGH